MTEQNLRELNSNTVCGRPQERVSPILVTLTSCSDSNFERSNISFKENKPDGVDLSSNGLNYCARKNESQTVQFRQTEQLVDILLRTFSGSFCGKWSPVNIFIKLSIKIVPA